MRFKIFKTEVLNIFCGIILTFNKYANASRKGEIIIVTNKIFPTNID